MSGPEHVQPFNRRASRFDRRFYAVGTAVLAAAIAGEILGADSFSAYPTIQLSLDPATLVLAALLVLSGLAPLRRKPRRRLSASGAVPATRLRGPGAAPTTGVGHG